MNDFVDIARLSTRIRSTEAEHAGMLAGQVRQLADRQLARALEGAGDRALARARLPAGAVVAVQRLELHLKVAVDVPGDELAAGWAAAFEAGLARLLATVAPGDMDDDAPAAWFADAWAAERRHLERRIQGAADAWWAADLAGDDDSPAPLAPLTLLRRWLRRDPARALCTLADLARGDAHVTALLSPTEATALTRELLQRFARPDSPFGSAVHPVSGPDPEALSAAPGTTPGAPREARSALLHSALARLAGSHARLLAAAGNTEQAAPWLAALLLAEAPSATGLPAAHLARALAEAGAAGQSRADPPPPGPTPPAASPDDSETAKLAPHPVNAGGLLLLLRPLLRLDLLPAPEQLGTDLGDLALAALRRVLAPLPPGERAVAEERERPLLAVFAPECDWRERIALIPIRDPATANARLDALVAAIPADIAAAPGALRQVFGLQPASFGTQADTRLARLLLRPGALRATPWEAELSWPLAAIDLALRRAGWDQDPGWLPWLGRTIRFRFGDPS